MTHPAGCEPSETVSGLFLNDIYNKLIEFASIIGTSETDYIAVNSAAESMGLCLSF
jgi:hypothetical protein